MILHKSNRYGIKILIIAIFLFSFIVVMNSISAEPEVNSITITPENPEPGSDVTIIADISGENISIVNLTITHCDDQGCYVNQKTNMVLNPIGKYQAEMTLKDSGVADHIQYQFKIVLNNGTEHYLSEESWKTYFAADDENGDSDENGPDNDTPGFELMFLLVAIFISYLLYNKKR
jgi:hypothetical protein